MSHTSWKWLHFTTFCQHVILQVLNYSLLINEILKFGLPLAKYEKAAPVTIVMFEVDHLH